MAGTLVISNISDGTNSTSATNAIQGSAKAWVNFAGATGTVRTSYNVSSVTRNATGDYTVNFTAAFADTNYAAVASTAWQSGTALNAITTDFTTSRTTTAIRLGASCYTTGPVSQDPLTISLAVLR